MEYELRENEYYLIKQITNEHKAYSNKLYSTTEKTIKNITNVLIGRIEVYIYLNNNSIVDKTKELGRESKEIDKNESYYKYDILLKSNENAMMRLFNLIMYEKKLKENSIKIEFIYKTIENIKKIAIFELHKTKFTVVVKG